MLAPVALSVACLVSVAALLAADRLELGAWRVVTKLAASTSFLDAASPLATPIMLLSAIPTLKNRSGYSSPK